MRKYRTALVVLAGVLLAATSAVGQPMTRLATTVAAIARYPTFYHDKSIALVGAPVPVVGGAQTGLPIEAPRTFVIAPRTGTPPERTQEFRGRMFDIGRFVSDDSRLGPLNLPAIITSVMGDNRWPGRETLFVLTGATWSDPPPANDASLRALVLAPTPHDGRQVTVRGRFRGRNLFGDMPAWPREGQHDFVLQAADAAIWILGRRPRGDGFDLGTTNRAHTGRWLEVTGRLEIRDDLPVILAESIRTTEAQDDAEAEIEPVRPPLPPPDIVFSAPAQGEVLVPRSVVVRIQFSRPMDADSFTDRIAVRYTDDPTRPVPAFDFRYRAAPMALELTFEGPLAPAARVAVTLMPGITAADATPFAGATLTFTTSGNGR
jgi:hypothetical protein